MSIRITDSRPEKNLDLRVAERPAESDGEAARKWTSRLLRLPDVSRVFRDSGAVEACRFEGIYFCTVVMLSVIVAMDDSALGTVWPNDPFRILFASVYVASLIAFGLTLLIGKAFRPSTDPLRHRRMRLFLRTNLASFGILLLIRVAALAHGQPLPAWPGTVAGLILLLIPWCIVGLAGMAMFSPHAGEEPDVELQQCATATSESPPAVESEALHKEADAQVRSITQCRE